MDAKLIRRPLAGIVLALALAAGQAGAQAAAGRGGEAMLAAMRAVDARVATIGHRLATTNVALCARQEWRHGFVLLDLGQVSAQVRAAAAALFGRQSGLGIMALAAAGPAERAGLRAGDVLLSLGEADTNAAILAALPAAFADGEAELAIQRGPARLTVVVRAERGCRSDFQVVARNSRNARADGTTVAVNRGLVDYAEDDAELASVLAHEFAHNVLRHRVRLYGDPENRNGPARRPRTSEIRETEIEADRLSVYLMEAAGYDPQAAVRFWTRFGPHPLNFLRSGDHPGWESRVAAMDSEIVRIRQARAAGRAPAPDFVRLPMPY